LSGFVLIGEPNCPGIHFFALAGPVTSDTHYLGKFEQSATTSYDLEMLKYFVSANAILFFAGKSSVIETIRERFKRMLGWSAFTVHRDV
jgi:hypothetical protein